MQNRVVVHYLSSSIIKGITNDFFPHKKSFHLTITKTDEIRKIDINDLKAIFFVKTYEGDSGYKEKQDIERTGLGKKVKVSFIDGEVIFGYTQGYSPDRLGFSVVPVDPKSNNERVFVCTDATNDIGFVGAKAPFHGAGNKMAGKGPSVNTVDEYIIILCPSCGVKNKFKTSKIDMKPRCGKCKTRLV